MDDRPAFTIRTWAFGPDFEYSEILEHEKAPCRMGGSPSDVSEELMTWEKQKKGWRMSCDVGKATELLENKLWRRWSDGKVREQAVT